LTQKDNAKAVLLSFQKDPDDGVRATVMNEIKEWPDAAPIYKKYILDHEGDPKYAASVQSAKDCLVINRQMLNSKS